MGFGNAIVDVLRRLVGLSKEPQVVDLQEQGAPAVDDDPEDEPDDDEGQPSVQDEWDDMQAFAVRCEAEAIDLAGIDINDPRTYWVRYLEIEVPEGEKIGTRESRAKSAGFGDIRHWEWVSQYYQIKWSELIEQPEGPAIRTRPAFDAARAEARRRRSS